MRTAITRDIKVSVEVIYQPVYSKPAEREFVHVRIMSGIQIECNSRVMVNPFLLYVVGFV